MSKPLTEICTLAIEALRNAAYNESTITEYQKTFNHQQLTYDYTEYVWNNSAIPNILFSVFCLWLFGILLLASIMLSGVLFKNSYGCLLY